MPRYVVSVQFCTVDMPSFDVTYAHMLRMFGKADFVNGFETHPHIEYIAEDGTVCSTPADTLLAAISADVCEGCDHVIPPREDGSICNKHHAPSCIMYDADEE